MSIELRPGEGKSIGNGHQKDECKIDPRPGPRQLEAPHSFLPCVWNVPPASLSCTRSCRGTPTRDSNMVMRLSGLETWLNPVKVSVSTFNFWPVSAQNTCYHPRQVS